MNKELAVLLAVIGVGVLLIMLYINSGFRTKTRVFSDYVLLNSTWEKYKVEYLNKDGRVIDRSKNNITTSEGQSYAMLRSVWSDDQSTFDLVWKWTRENLDHKDDSLFSWQWGKRKDNSYGPLADGGENSASDADSDIALALIFASRRWHDAKYLDQARKIMVDIWKYETEAIEGKRYLLAGRWATSQTEIILNPSYFAPYAWRIFSKVDKERDWNSLIIPAYEVLNASGRLTLNNKKRVGLPPDWISLRKDTGELRAPAQPVLTVDYSYDAMRVPWRIAIDYIWFKEAKAFNYLSSLSKLSQVYKQNKMLVATYGYDGNPTSNYESPSMYATALAYFFIVEPETAEEIYNNKIIVLYNNDANELNPVLTYYDQNWLWFGLALYRNKLPNLYAQQ